MLMIVILVGILIAALGVSAWMWFQVQKEAVSVEQNSAVPLLDLGAMEHLAEPVVDQHMVEQQRVLEGENEALKARVAGLEASLSAVDQNAAKVEHLIVENSAFRARVSEVSAESSCLKEVVARLERENQQLENASRQVDASQALVQQAKEEYQRQLENAFKQVEELRTENTKLQQQVTAGEEVDLLKQSTEELAGKVRELEMVNAIQTEKNEYLQYELIKSRAQVVGLERVCESLSPLASVER
jgi:chromosome segregation ATPase